MTGLRARLAAWAAVIALTATGLPGLWLTWRAYAAQRAQAFESQLALSASLAAEIDGELSLAINAVETLAERPELLADRRRLNTRLDLVASTAERLDDLMVVDLDGKLLARAPQLEGPPAFSQDDRRDLARQARAARGQSVQTVSQVHREPDGGLVLRLAHWAGHSSAVLGQLRMEAQGIGSLEEIKIGRRGFAYLVDERGQPLVLPNLSQRLNLVSTKAQSLAFPFEGKAFVHEVPGELGADLLAATPLATVGWAVAVRRPLEEAEAGARRMRAELVLFVALALLASGALALALARPLVNSLLSLAAAAERIESGTLDPGELERLPAPDEVGQVASALAHMVRALKVQQSERERAHSRALAAEQRLARSERLASLGQLAAGLAHELNSPLMVIHGAAGEAAALSPKPAQPWLERVRRESERCSRLVRELLDFARPRSPSLRAFDLAALTREVFEHAKVGRKPPYALQWQGQPSRVRADRDQFQQVLVNLLNNAMDAMPGGGTLSAELQAHKQGWRLRVRDQGTGIAARQREAVFRPFFTGKPQGTGLGLAIARSLMAGHGGTLRCVPTKGKGATFEAEWPTSGRPDRG